MNSFGRAGLAGFSALLCLVGCGSKPKEPDIQERTRREAKLEAPKRVKAGPYALNFVPEGAKAAYVVWNEEDRHGMLQVNQNFEFERPKGPWAKVRLVTKTPELGPGLGGGEGFLPLSGPKPQWLDSVSFSALVPLEWKGDRLDLRAKIEEFETAHYTASLTALRFSEASKPYYDHSLWNPLRVEPFMAEDVTLADGVSATISPVENQPERLQVVVRWDAKRILPDVKSPMDPFSPRVTSNVILSGVYEGGEVGKGERTFVFDLKHDPSSGPIPQRMDLTFEFSKMVRSYPIQIPLKLKWDGAKAKATKG